MSELWVVNASPIISLAKAGYLDLLEKVAPGVLVPEAVAAEVLAGPSSDPARKALETGWGHRAPPRDIPGEILEWGLGAGESAVLALSMEKPGRTAVLDDAAADALRARLEEQLRADVELLYEAHRIKMRAFETVWRTQAELDAALQPPPPPPAGSGKRQETITLLPSGTPPPTASPEEDGRSPAEEILPVPDAVVAVFHQLPEIFDKHDLHRALGFEPSRSTLFRVLKDLIQEGSLRVESTGTGRRTSRFRKLTARHHEADPEQDATRHSSIEPLVERNEKTGERDGAQLDHGA